MKIAKEMNEDVFAKNPLCYGGASTREERIWMWRSDV